MRKREIPPVEFNDNDVGKFAIKTYVIKTSLISHERIFPYILLNKKFNNKRYDRIKIFQWIGTDGVIKFSILEFYDSFFQNMEEIRFYCNKITLAMKVTVFFSIEVIHLSKQDPQKKEKKYPSLIKYMHGTKEKKSLVTFSVFLGCL